MINEQKYAVEGFEHEVKDLNTEYNTSRIPNQIFTKAIALDKEDKPMSYLWAVYIDGKLVMYAAIEDKTEALENALGLK